MSWLMLRNDLQGSCAVTPNSFQEGEIIVLVNAEFTADADSCFPLRKQISEIIMVLQPFRETAVQG